MTMKSESVDLVLFLCKNSFKYLYNVLIENRFHEKILSQILNDDFIVNNAVSRFLQFFSTHSTQLNNYSLSTSDPEVSILVKNKLLNELLTLGDIGEAVGELAKLENMLKVYKLTLFNRSNYVEFDRNLPLSYEKDKSLLMFDDSKLITELKLVVRNEILSFFDCLNFLFNYTLEHDCKVIKNVITYFEDFRSQLFSIYTSATDLQVCSAALLNLINLHYVSNRYTKQHFESYRSTFSSDINKFKDDKNTYGDGSNNGNSAARDKLLSLQDTLLAFSSLFGSFSSSDYYGSSFPLYFKTKSDQHHSNTNNYDHYRHNNNNNSFLAVSEAFGTVAKYLKSINTNIVNIILLKVFPKLNVSYAKKDLADVIKGNVGPNVSPSLVSNRESGPYIPLYLLRNEFFKTTLSDDCILNIHIINYFMLQNYPISLLKDLVNTEINSIQLGQQFNSSHHLNTLGDKGANSDLYNSVLLLLRNDKELSYIISTLASIGTKSVYTSTISSITDFLVSMLILNKNFLKKLGNFPKEFKLTISNVETNSTELLLVDVFLKLHAKNRNADFINSLLRFFYVRFLTIESLISRICNTLDKDGRKVTHHDVKLEFKKMLHEVLVNMKLDIRTVEMYLVLLNHFYTRFCHSKLKNSVSSTNSNTNTNTNSNTNTGTPTNFGCNYDKIDPEILTRMYRFILNTDNRSNLLTFLTIVKNNCNELVTDFIMLLINNRNYDTLVQSLRCNTLYNYNTNQLIVYNSSAKSRKLLNSWDNSVAFDEVLKLCPVEISLNLFKLVLEVVSSDEKLLSFYVKNCFNSLLVTGPQSRDLLNVFKSLKVLSINYSQAFNALQFLYKLSFDYYNMKLALSMNQFGNFGTSDSLFGNFGTSDSLFVNKHLSDMELCKTELKGVNKDLMMYLLNLIVVNDGDCDISVYELLKYLIYNCYFGYKYNIINNKVIVSFDKVDNFSEVSSENVSFTNIQELCNNILIKFINQNAVGVDNLTVLYSTLSVLTSQHVVTENVNLILNKLINYCITSFEVTENSYINTLPEELRKIMLKTSQLLVQKLFILVINCFDKVNSMSITQLGNFIVTTKSSNTFTYNTNDLSDVHNLTSLPHLQMTNLGNLHNLTSLHNGKFSNLHNVSNINFDDVKNVLRRMLLLYFILTTKGPETSEDTFTLFCLYKLVKLLNFNLVLNINEWRLLLLRLCINKYKDKLYLKYLFKLYNILQVSETADANGSNGLTGHANGSNGLALESCSVLEVNKLEKDAIDNYYSQELNSDMIIFLYNISTKVSEDYLDKVVNQIIHYIKGKLRFTHSTSQDTGSANSMSQDTVSTNSVTQDTGYTNSVSPDGTDKILKTNLLMVKSMGNMMKNENLKLFYVFYNEFERFGESCFKEINRLVSERISYLTTNNQVKNSKYYIYFFKYLVRFKNHNQIVKLINNIHHLNYYFYLIFLYSIANNHSFDYVQLINQFDFQLMNPLDIQLMNPLDIQRVNQFDNNQRVNPLDNQRVNPLDNQRVNPLDNQRVNPLDNQRLNKFDIVLNGVEKGKVTDLEILLKNVLCERVKCIVNYPRESVVLYNELLLIMNLVMLCNDVETVTVVVEDLYNFILGKSSDRLIFLKIVNNFINLLFKFGANIKILKSIITTLINIITISAGASGYSNTIMDSTTNCTNNNMDNNKYNSCNGMNNVNNNVNSVVNESKMDKISDVCDFGEIVRPESLGLNLYNLFFHTSEKIKLSNLDMFLPHFDAMYEGHNENQKLKIKLLTIINEKLKVLYTSIH